MLSGELYMAWDEDLTKTRVRAHLLCDEYNNIPREKKEEKAKLLSKLFGACGDAVHIEKPFHCDYGENIELGDHVYMNFNCTILDCIPLLFFLTLISFRSSRS